MEIITSHMNADFDSLASMVAASKLHPEAKLVFLGAIGENLRHYLARHPEITPAKASRINLADIKRVILVDTNLGGHFGNFAQVFANPGIEVCLYDHHPRFQNSVKPKVEIIRSVGANTTLMVELLRRRKIPISPIEATLYAIGIYEDTGFLTFSSTTKNDMKAAAYLLDRGADLSQISDYIRHELSGEQIALLNDLMQNTQNIVIHDVQIAIAGASVENYVGEVAILAHKLRDIENADAVFVLINMENHLHLIARSRRAEVNVGELLKNFGGGGHATAASASIKDLSISQVQEKLLQLLREQIPPQKTAAQIMTSPVKTVLATATVQDAKTLLIRTNINNLPVVNTQKKLLGIINRQIVDKALSHGLENYPVAEVMHCEVETVTLQDGLDTVKQRMMERHQQFLPVLRDHKITGIITRTDLLRVLHEQFTPVPGPFAPESLHKKNMKGLLRERICPPILDVLLLAGEVADELGFGIYVVGGAVRDMLLRKENLDVDVVVENNGILFARRLADKVKGHFRSHEKFGTAVVVFPSGFKLDVATARTEYYQHPAALPIVEQSSIKQDLFRRDFTINALAIKINAGEFGDLLDYFGGQQDMKNGVIRVLHSLSLVEDPTRVFRAIRFEQRFGFHIGKHTLTLIKSAVKKDICAILDSSRLLNELSLIFQENEVCKAIARMQEFDLLKYIHPRLKLSAKDLAIFTQIKTVLDWYNLLFLHRSAERWILFLLGFADFLTLEECRELNQRLGLTNRYAQLVIKSHQLVKTTLHQLQRQKDMFPSRIYILLHTVLLDILLLILAKSQAPLARQRLSLYLTKLQHKHTLIGGWELKEMGFPPGPIFSQIKEELLHARLDGKIKSKEDELNYVRERFKA
ncbi:MAG: CBS domain-containing protein [Candidatus Schekmanbacteria bacterium]|nr:CBS domain-containing protein [Candidatus Schekmanbacteria bacterium]